MSPNGGVQNARAVCHPPGCMRYHLYLRLLIYIYIVYTMSSLYYIDHNIIYIYHNIICNRLKMSFEASVARVSLPGRIC